jgi:phosphoribosylanthranilate isomerase
VVKVKICGITNLMDAQAAQAAGCDALGFIFYKKSKRFIRPEVTKEIIGKLAKKVRKVGVFVDEREKTIKNIANSCGLDILQFHGKETPEFCARFKGYKVIKAFRVKRKIDFNKALKYKTFGYLFDTFEKSRVGGTGKSFNWNLLRPAGRIKREIFLSGGLSSKNVKKAIGIVKPDWVDVSSSVESKPGEKDFRKVCEFIKIAKD